MDVSGSGWIRLFAAAAGGALLLLAVPACAQDGDQAGQSSLAGLHKALNLAPWQESGWQTYTAAMAPPPVEDRQRAAMRMFPTLHAPQRMDLITAEIKQELADHEQQAQALKTFYATLSQQQQAVFDQKTLPPVRNDGSQP
ncbi:MAG: Spy/CpxP family protein refolding chaperone [Sphingomonadales bacterium]|nr:Spy/CpxP family protein refolding chaperone [Sphingomonadales bacterium]